MSAWAFLAKGFLLFSDAFVIAPLLIIGFATRGGFFVERPSTAGHQIWSKACLLVLFTMIFNVFLKSLFLIPLNPALGLIGYAFPSGHMQVAIVFYGWLMMSYSHQLWRVLLIVILAGIGYGLIQQGYHNIYDILASVGFGIATLYIFEKVSSSSSIQKNPLYLPLYLLGLSLIMIAGIWFRIGISCHIRNTFFGLVGFILLWWLFEKTIWKRKNK